MTRAVAAHDLKERKLEQFQDGKGKPEDCMGPCPPSFRGAAGWWQEGLEVGEVCAALWALHFSPHALSSLSLDLSTTLSAQPGGRGRI